METFFKNKIILIFGSVIIIALAFYVGLHSNKATNQEIIYPNQPVASQGADTGIEPPVSGDHANPKTYDYAEAPQHINEYAKVTGSIVDVYTAKSGTTFLDFCTNYKMCPFSGVIFSSDSSKFKNLKSYVGPVTIEGDIKSYQGKAEIIINDPAQITKGN